MITKMTQTTTGNVRGTLWCSGILIPFVFFTAHCDGRTTVRKMMSETESINYLSRHGYLPPLNTSEGEIISEEAMSEAISELQSDVGIPVTGELDVATIRHMSIPRCGVNDKRRITRNAQWEEYKLWGYFKWNRKHLTYKILNYPRRLQTEAVDKEIRKAFNMWARHTFLRGKQVFHGKADINISFDKSISDGPDENLAEATTPGFACSIKFDAAETWTIKSRHGINLLQVATHEFGHTFGIDHSEVRSAVMWPYSSEYDPNFRLHIDDVKAIQLTLEVNPMGLMCKKTTMPIRVMKHGNKVEDYSCG